MIRSLLAAALLLTLTAAVPVAQAQVSVNIGINLPGPPTLRVVPGVPVYYAPGAPANVFFYANQYWVFTSGAWYVGPTWSGPWGPVTVGYVPAPILRVPLAYYRVPPPAWRGWRRDAPPRWAPAYGREWREEPHERNWREREDHDRGRHEGRERGRGR
ncbi:MAG TPA: hypothetical protein VFL90_19165 [Methylomirabilota bacterium]|nr:hypothetical protein [Methylomirabilota bacterium]